MEQLRVYRTDALALWSALKDSYDRGEISVTQWLQAACEIRSRLDLMTVDLGDHIQLEHQDLTNSQTTPEA